MNQKLPSYAIEDQPTDANPSLVPVSHRNHQLHAMELLSTATDITRIGKVVEVGGSIGSNFRSRLPNSEYLNLDLEAGDGALPTLVCDVTDDVPLEKDSVDFIYSNNCFEHIAAPWLAANQLSKILKPGGYLYVSAPWAWRYHPVPIDYWRFSPQALSYLFSELETLASGFNTAFRRDDIRGFWPNRMDAVPVDELGGWRENWLSFVFCRKR